jgi:hypothetical protein
MSKTQDVASAQIYRRDIETDRYLIEVALDRYEDIFNEWDPAPFKRRDIHPNLTEFFEECSMEINLKHRVAIVFYLPKGEIDLEKQEHCIRGLRNHFGFAVHILRKRLARVERHAMRNIVIGLFFLFVATFLETKISATLLSSVLVQGLFIGGWVFIWEAFSSVIFKESTTRTKIKEWERLSESPISFRKETKPQ